MDRTKDAGPSGLTFLNSSLAEKLARLRKVPVRRLPGVVYGRMSRRAFSWVERRVYKRDAAWWRKRVLPVPGRVGVVHGEVFEPGFGRRFGERFPRDRNAILDEADRAVDLVFDLLGSGPVDLKTFRDRTDLHIVDRRNPGRIVPARATGRVPWHFDFKSGVGWDPNVYFADVRFGETRGVDVKVPWELSRCAHFVTLGQAYRLTSDEKYARAFMSQIEDWLEQNPVKYGVNWVCPMDVGLRACNWLAALELFEGSAAISNEFRGRLAYALLEHGRHIRRHLETGGGTPSNHYLSDLLGLSYIGTALGVDSWRRFARNELLSEAQTQIHEDGLDYEASTGYHRLVFELYFYFTRVARQGSSAESIAGALGERFEARFAAMVRTLLDLVRPDGTMPFIGDQDSGRVHVWLRRPDADIRFLIALGALALRQSTFGLNAWGDRSEVVWLFGFSGFHADHGAGVSLAAIPSRPPGPSGLVTMRGAADHLTFSAQPIGTRGVGNHTHNDKLSLTLWAGGEEFLVDPGSGVYTPDTDLRDRLRSTASHNTVEIDGAEQNRFLGTFLMAADGETRIDHWDADRSVAGFHTGYERLTSGVTHHRRIDRSEDGRRWTITDRFSGDGRHAARWSFVAAPHLAVEIAEPGRCVLRGRHGGLEIRFDSAVGAEIDDVPYSPAYGVILATRALRLRQSFEVPAEFIFSLGWSADLALAQVGA